jgi:peptidoglycan hydrolase-like protein with peptidoglycan-binding domain
MLEARSDRGRRFPRWAMVALVVVLVAGTAVAAYVLGHAAPPSRASDHLTGSTTSTPAAALRLVTTTPASGATGVASDSAITLAFSSSLAVDTVAPTLTPAVAGTWSQPTRTSLRFDPSAPFPPFASETVTVPSGPTGLRATDGGRLAAATTLHFTVADGDMLRLQQLLAQLGYLPLTFTPTGPPAAPAAMATAQPGNFAWKWATLPTALTSQWTPGYEDIITKAAIESFENQNNLTVDGLAGPQVWATALADVTAAKTDTTPYVYVLVSKVIPENLTLWNNGVAQFSGVPVNTGLHGADTTDGTYAVFEHVTASEMKGTNPDGSHYDDPAVPWASFFNGGDALHGFVRATYGTPQSNGCVEMSPDPDRHAGDGGRPDVLIPRPPAPRGAVWSGTPPTEDDGACPSVWSRWSWRSSWRRWCSTPGSRCGVGRSWSCPSSWGGPPASWRCRTRWSRWR